MQKHAGGRRSQTSQMVGRIGKLLLGMAFIASLAACGGSSDSTSSFASAWTAPQQDYNENLPAAFGGGRLAPPISFSNQTIRQIVHVSYGGPAVRLKFSNMFGQAPVTLSSIRVAKSTGGSNIDTTTDQAVLFSGANSVTLPPGVEVLSDPIDYALGANANIAVSLFVPAGTPAGSGHITSVQTNYVASGNVVSAASLTVTETATSYFWLAAVDAAGADKPRVMVAFGDSITDGFQSTIDANSRWPNLLDNKIQAAGTFGRFSVVNAGIAGNRWIYDLIGPNGSGRFGHDVLGVPGVTHVTILMGINDLGLGQFVPGQSVTSDQVIAAITTAVQRAKGQGLKVFLGTLLPVGGSIYDSPTVETERSAINTWIRANATVDGVLDFDQVVRDPGNPTAILPAFDSGDHIHPNDQGYQAMANAFPLGEL